MLSLVFGDHKSPYYIWAPRWIEASAGIRALHYLCHSLNSMGETAFIVFTEPVHNNEPRVSGKLFTPELTDDIVRSHLSQGRNPIAIYPETVVGNPLGAATVVRLLMNYSGVLNGPLTFEESDIIFAFSKKISEDYKNKSGVAPPVLFIPTVDPREFAFSSEKEPFQVVYAGKYRSFVGRPPKVGNLPSIEIFRDGPKKQSRALVKSLISRASVVFSFENSSIVTEAILSGTPAGFIPNKFLGEVIGEKELGWAGTFMGDGPASIEQARLTVAQGAKRYLGVVNKFPESLKVFIQETQFSGSSTACPPVITLPNLGGVISKNRLMIAYSILKRQGPWVLFRELWKFLRSQFRH